MPLESIAPELLLGLLIRPELVFWFVLLGVLMRLESIAPELGVLMRLESIAPEFERELSIWLG